MGHCAPKNPRVALLLSGHLRGFGKDHVAALEGLPRDVDIYAFAWVDGAQSGVQAARVALDAHCQEFGGSFRLLTAEQTPKEAAADGVVDPLPIEWMWLAHRRASRMYLDSECPRSEQRVLARARFDVSSRVNWQIVPGPNEVFLPITDKWGSLALPTDMFALYGADLADQMSEIWSGVGQLSRDCRSDGLVAEQYLMMHLIRQRLILRVLDGDVTLYREAGYRVPVQFAQLGRMRLCNLGWQHTRGAEARSRFAGQLDATSSKWIGFGQHDSEWPLRELDLALEEKLAEVDRRPAVLLRPLNLLLLLRVAAAGRSLNTSAQHLRSRVALQLVQLLSVPLDLLLRRLRTTSQRLDVAYRPDRTAALEEQTNTRRRIGRSVPFSFRIYRRFVLPVEVGPAEIGSASPS